MIKLSKQEVNFIFGGSSDKLHDKKTNTTSNNEQKNTHSVIVIAFAVVGAIAATYYIGKLIFNCIDRQERYFYNKAHFLKVPKFFYKEDKDKSMA